MARAETLVDSAADGTAAPAPAPLRVELVYAAKPQRVEREQLLLAPGSSVRDALRASALVAQLAPAELDALGLSLWGRTCDTGTLLQPDDRLALLRPLLVDPKEARRQRYRRDGLQKRPPRQRRPGPGV